LKHNTVLIVLSLLNALFFGLHLTGDIVFGIEKGGREILVGVLILAVYLYGAVGLPERLTGYIRDFCGTPVRPPGLPPESG
jgi:hypothetical protein